MSSQVQDVLHVQLVKQEIRDALSRYCRAMDRRDEPLAAATWHADGTADYGQSIFVGSGAGFAKWVTEIHLGFDRTSTRSRTCWPRSPATRPFPRPM